MNKEKRRNFNMSATQASLRIQKIRAIDAFLKKHKMSVKTILSGRRWNGFFKSQKEKYTPSEVKTVCSYFSGIRPEDILDDSRKLPEEEKWGLERKTEKLNALDSWLSKEKGVNLYRALSLSETKMKKILSGAELPSKRILKITADYFFMDADILADDEKDLPENDKLAIDEDLAAIQRDDFSSQTLANKNKHVVRRNWRILSHSKRVGVVLSLFGVLAPLVAFTAYCSYVEINDRLWAQEAYKNDAMSSEAQKIETSLSHTGNFTEVKVGAILVSISNITTSSYDASMALWFDFDQLSFHKTMCSLNATVGLYEDDVVKKYLADTGTSGAIDDAAFRYFDEVSYSSKTSKFTNEPDGIPDFLEIDYSSVKFPLAFDHSVYQVKDSDGNYLNAAYGSNHPSPAYDAEVSCYPGQTSSNNYTDNTNMFSMERGGFDADSFSYDFLTPYSIAPAGKGAYEAKEFRIFQKCSFGATITKDSYGPRYPLDSAQFYIYVKPKFTADYFRYSVADTINLASDTSKEIYTYGTAEPTAYKAGLSSSFKVSNGYKLIDNSSVSSYVTRLDYSGTLNEDGTYKDVMTHYVFLTRVNRSGPGLFLQAFANIFAITIWIIIAFYDQAYNSSDSIGMLGTGLFGIISSVLVGISMVSNSDIFSLITMINIFTLFVIILMTYEAVVSKRAYVKKDRAAIAYNTVKLRIMFYIIVFCTLAMFIGLPLICYIFF
jgi:hypothetical protein